jgi:hypothetical protein
MKQSFWRLLIPSFYAFPPMEQTFDIRATSRPLRYYVVLDIKKSNLWSSSFSLQKWKITEVANVDIIFLSFIIVIGRSQWLHSLSCGPIAIACWDCGFESPRGLGCLSLVSAVCCRVEVSDGLPNVACECDPEALVVRMPWPTKGLCTIGEGGRMTVIGHKK